MINRDNKIFEQMLVRKYQDKPTPDLSEVLIKEFSAHKIKNTEPTTELNNWIKARSKETKNRRSDITDIFGLRGAGSRPKMELTYISMNAFCWLLVLKNKSLQDAVIEVSRIFNESIEKVEIGFHRKNHDFGERELCRFGLDICFAIIEGLLTNEQKIIIRDILGEGVEVQMMKDYSHHRARFNLKHKS
tara:strand:- start:2539 stop:3105 length:567 start_codon:yes stop_codon:yes gene_type:complete